MKSDVAISKALLPWRRDYELAIAGVRHPWILRALRVPFKVIDGCKNPMPMLVRYRLLDTPLGSLNVHHFLRGDEDRDCHDHPFAFVTLILRGGYYEHTPFIEPWKLHSCCTYDLVRLRRPGDLLFRRATWAHRVELLNGGERDCWTLIAMSKKIREWGFLTHRGWMPFRKYHSIAGCAEAES